MNLIKPSVFADWCLSESDSYLPQKLTNKGLFLDDYISKDGAQILKKDIPGL